MDKENIYKIIMLSDMIIDDYHLEPGITINLESQIGDRRIHVAITLKGDKEDDD